MRFLAALLATLLSWTSLCAAQTLNYYSLTRSATGTNCGGSVPTQAAAVGYNTCVYDVESFASSNVDTGLTFGAGFQIYYINFRSYNPSTSLADTTLNSDGSATINGGGG